MVNKVYTASSSVTRNELSKELIYFWLIFLLLVLFRWQLLLGKIPAGLDNCLIMLPLYSLAELRPLALWNPFEFCGMPLLGNSAYAMFYLPRWIFHLVEAPRIYPYYVFGHYLFSGIGMFLLCRHVFSQPPVAAILSALTWMCGAFLLGRQENILILLTTVWTPWICWLIVSAIWQCSYTRAYVTAFSLAMAFHSGSPQAFFYSVVIGSWAVFYALVNLPFGQKLDFKRRMAVFAFMTVVSAGLIAPGWFPVMEHLQVSIRAESTFETLAQDALPWRWIVNLFIGGTHLPEYTDASVYTGLTSLILILLAVWQMQWKRIFLLMLLIVSGIWLALGPKAGLYSVISWIPIVKFISGPLRALVLVAFPLAILAGEALSVFVQQNLQQIKKTLPYLALSGLSGGGVALIFYLHSIVPAYRWKCLLYTRYLSAEDFLRLNTSLILLIVAIWLWLYLKLQRWRTVVCWLFVGLVVADLVHFMPRIYLYYRDADEYFSAPASIRFLQQINRQGERCVSHLPTKLFALFVEDQRNRHYAAPKLCDYFRIPNTAGLDAAMSGFLPRTVEALGIRNPHDDPIRTLSFKRADHPFMDVLNVRYILGNPTEYLVSGGHILLTDNNPEQTLELSAEDEILGVGILHLIDNALNIPQGEVIGEVVLLSAPQHNIVQRFSMRAGLEVADWRCYDAGFTCEHQRLVPAVQWLSAGMFKDHIRTNFYKHLELSKPVKISAVQLRKLKSGVIWDVNAISVMAAARAHNFKRVFSSPQVEIYENLRVLPKLQWLQRWEIVNSLSSARLRLQKIEPELLRELTVIISDEIEKFNQLTSGTAEITVLQSNSNELQAKVSATGAGFIRISQQWHPGWQVQLNGKKG